MSRIDRTLGSHGNVSAAARAARRLGGSQNRASSSANRRVSATKPRSGLAAPATRAAAWQRAWVGLLGRGLDPRIPDGNQAAPNEESRS
jgi:hypothetical protein